MDEEASAASLDCERMYNHGYYQCVSTLMPFTRIDIDAMFEEVKNCFEKVDSNMFDTLPNRKKRFCL
jgi:hypothetical protein